MREWGPEVEAARERADEAYRTWEAAPTGANKAFMSEAMREYARVAAAQVERASPGPYPEETLVWGLIHQGPRGECDGDEG